MRRRAFNRADLLNCLWPPVNLSKNLFPPTKKAIG